MYNSYSVFVICHFTWSANPDYIRHNRKTTHWSVPTWGGPTKWTTNEINFTILRYFRSRKKDSFVRGFAWTQKHAGDQKHTKILVRKVTISLAAGRKIENILIRKGVRVAQPLFLFVYYGSRILQIELTELSVRLQWIWNYSSINQSKLFSLICFHEQCFWEARDGG